MALTGSGGSPPGTTLGGPIHCITNMEDTAGAIRARGPLYLTTNATGSAGHIAGLTPIYFGVGAGKYTNDTTQSMYVAGPGAFATASNANTWVATQVTMPFAGSVMAISARANGAAPPATTIAAKIAGTRQTGAMSVTIAKLGSKTFSSVTDMTSFPFAAGADLEVVYDGGGTAMTKDISAILWTL